MNTSEKGIALIKYFEGVLAQPYKCPGGYWTVGVGHLITRNAKLPDTWDRTLEPNEIDGLLIFVLVFVPLSPIFLFLFYWWSIL